MAWNYRIIHYKEGGFGLHEVHYDERGRPANRTVRPVSFGCDEDEGAEGVVKSLQRALGDAQKAPVLQEPEFWPGEKSVAVGQVTSVTFSSSGPGDTTPPVIKNS